MRHFMRQSLQIWRGLRQNVVSYGKTVLWHRVQGAYSQQKVLEIIFFCRFLESLDSQKMHWKGLAWISHQKIKDFLKLI